MTEEVLMGAEMQAAELEALKAQADRLGIKYRDNISYEKLRERVAAAMAEEPAVTESSSERRARLKRKMEELVRVRVIPLDPVKAQLKGEFFMAGNRVQTMRKYVPFDTPWHVPRIILDVIKSKKTQQFVEKRNPDTGQKYTEARMVNMYAVEELPPLTKEELQELADRQARTGAVAD